MEQHQYYTEVRDTVSIKYNRFESDSRVSLVQKITVERIIFELVASTPLELTFSQSIGGDIDTLSCSHESSCDVLTRSRACNPAECDSHPSSYNDYCGSDDNTKVLDYIRRILNAARQITPEPTVVPCIEVSCSESTCNDTLVRSIRYQSALDEMNTCRCCLNRYFGSDGMMNNVQGVPDFLGVLTSTQHRTEETTTKIKLKAALGKMFTEFLVQLCYISIEAIENERNVVHSNSEVYKQYTNTIIELTDAIKLLMIIRHKFCTIHAGQVQQSGDILQYVLLPILLGTATKTVDIIKTLLRSFWRTWLPSNVGIALLTYNGISQVVNVNAVKNLECMPLCEVADIIQELKACLDKIDTLKKTSKAFNINTDYIASLCSHERASMELSIGQ